MEIEEKKQVSKIVKTTNEKSVKSATLPIDCLPIAGFTDAGVDAVLCMGGKKEERQWYGQMNVQY